MTFDRRRFLTGAGLAVAAPAVMRVTRANAQEVTLKMHHFLPPVTVGHAKFLKPLGGQGRGRIERPHQDRHLPSRCSLAARRRSFSTRRVTASPTWSGRCRAYTPGRFTGLEAFELPFVANKRALVNSLAVTEYAQQKPQGRTQGRASDLRVDA